MPRIAPVVGLVCAGCLVPAVPPALAAFPGENGRILFDSPGGRDGDLWTVSRHGGKPVNLTAASDANESAGSWRADGRRIVFMSDRETPRNPDPRGKRSPDFEIFVMRANGSNPTQLTFNTFDDEDPAWSPDGQRIVFVRDFNPTRGKVRYDILTMRADGTDERNITDRPSDDFQPAWSSNGKIAFTSDRDGDTELFTMRPNGSNVRKLTHNRFPDEFANWSPNGKSIVFHSERNDNFDVYTLSVPSRKERRVTRHPDGEGIPTWSPDGREIAFTRFSESGPKLFTMRTDGSRQVRRTGGKLEPFGSDWQPARRR